MLFLRVRLASWKSRNQQEPMWHTIWRKLNPMWHSHSCCLRLFLLLCDIVCAVSRMRYVRRSSAAALLFDCNFLCYICIFLHSNTWYFYSIRTLSLPFSLSLYFMFWYFRDHSSLCLLGGGDGAAAAAIMFWYDDKKNEDRKRKSVYIFLSGRYGFVSEYTFIIFPFFGSSFLFLVSLYFYSFIRNTRIEWIVRKRILSLSKCTYTHTQIHETRNSPHVHTIYFINGTEYTKNKKRN